MKRKFINVMLILLAAFALAMCFVACGGDGGNSGTNHNGTYYLFSDGQYIEKSYINIDGKKWTGDEGTGKIGGECRISGTSISLYVELFGESEVWIDGVINNGVIETKDFNGTVYYCKRGKVPSDIKGGTTNTKGAFSNDSYSGFKALDGFNQTELVIPAYYDNRAVVKIADNGFENCTSLTSVVIPDSVTSIGKNAFKGCVNLESVTLPSNLKNINDNAFDGCEKLKNVTLPSNLESIGRKAFNDCKLFTAVGIPDTVKEIANGAFYGCENLLYVTLPNVDEIIMGNFSNAFPKMASPRVTILGGTKIPNSAFDYCNISAVDLPDTLTEIGSRAFGNTSMYTIRIPQKVTEIGYDAFPKKIIEIENYSNVLITGEHLYSNSQYVHVIHSPLESNLIMYGDYAFFRYDDGDYALVGLDADTLLEDIELPTDVKQYGIVLANDYTVAVDALGYGFIKSVKIPSNITSFKDNAFSWCVNLTSVYYNGNIAQWCGISFDDFGANPLHNGANLYINNELITELVIPDTVTEIGSCAFAGCGNLTSVNS